MSPVQEGQLPRMDRNEPVGPGEKCVRCGYPLEGLPRGGKCPECGTSIRVRRAAGVQARDNLTDAPLDYLYRIRARFMTLAAVGLVCSLLQAAWIVVTPLWTTAAQVLPFCMTIAAAGWFAAVFRATTPRPFVPGMRIDPRRERERLRLAARIAPAAWIVQGAALTGASAAPGSPMLVLAQVAQVAGIVGLAPLCILMADIAEWAQDTTLGARLRVSSVLLASGGVAAVISAITPFLPLGFVAGALGFTGMITLLACICGAVLFLAAQLQLANLSAWAIRNAEAASERDQRVLERKARRMFSGDAAAGSPLAEMTAARGEQELEPCAGCGYDLTGLPAGAPCPECGRAQEGTETSFIQRARRPPPADDAPLPLAGDENPLPRTNGPTDEPRKS